MYYKGKHVKIADTDYLSIYISTLGILWDKFHDYPQTMCMLHPSVLNADVGFLDVLQDECERIGATLYFSEIKVA